MSREKLDRVSCDRCKNVIEETPVTAAGETGAEIAPLLYIERKGKKVIKFDDLCQKCDDRCVHLLKQLRLEKDDGKGDKTSATKDTTSGKKPNRGEDKAAGDAPAAAAG